MKLSLMVTLVAFISLTGCERRLATDSTLTATIKGKLTVEPTTSAARIGVDTTNSVVTLSGTVPSEAERADAERVARNTRGVTQVVNNIKVEHGEPNSGGVVSDATILASVKSQLLANGIFGTNVDVQSGDVTITGTMNTAQEKAKAEEIARQVSGVKSVNNQLTIKR